MQHPSPFNLLPLLRRRDEPDDVLEGEPADEDGLGHREDDVLLVLTLFALVSWTNFFIRKNVGNCLRLGYLEYEMSCKAPSKIYLKVCRFEQ